MAVRAHRSRGFSLLELVVVVVVLSVVAAMVVPEFSGTYHHALLRGATREAVAVMHLAYSQAVTTGRVHHLCVDTARGRFWLETRALRGDRRFQPVTNVPGSAGRFDPRIRVRIRASGEEAPGPWAGEPAVPPEGSAPAAEALVFRPDGTSEARELRLEDEEGFAMVVRVHPATSRVRVIDAGREVTP